MDEKEDTLKELKKVSIVDVDPDGRRASTISEEHLVKVRYETKYL